MTDDEWKEWQARHAEADQELRRMTDAWEERFAWVPVRLLSWEWAWLRMVKRRPAIAGPPWSYGRWDYAN